MVHVARQTGSTTIAVSVGVSITTPPATGPSDPPTDPSGGASGDGGESSAPSGDSGISNPPSSQPPPPSSDPGIPSSQPLESSSTPSSTPVSSAQSSSKPLSSSLSSSTSLTTSTSKTEDTIAKTIPSTAAVNTTEASAISSITSFTTFVTQINGHSITVTSALPTTLINANTTSSSHRTSAIAGATAGVVALLLVILGGIFGYRRHKLRQQLLALTGKKKESKGLLDGEGFDDEVVPMRRYHDAAGAGMPPTPSGSSSGHGITPISAPPPLFRAHASQTGSIFREEGVWPPPGEESRFVDPFADEVFANSQVDLSKIVDDVMGPTASARNSSAAGGGGSGGGGGAAYASIGGTAALGGAAAAAGAGTSGHDRIANTSTASTSYSEFGAHDRTPTTSSTNSSTPLRPIPNPDSYNSMYADPFRDASHSGTATSVYYPSIAGRASSPPLPMGASQPMIPGLTSPLPVHNQQNTGGVSPSKNPSPLGSAGGNNSLWLGRKLQG